MVSQVYYNTQYSVPQPRIRVAYVMQRTSLGYYRRGASSTARRLAEPRFGRISRPTSTDPAADRFTVCSEIAQAIAWH
jgi:hypothetical protein